MRSLQGEAWQASHVHLFQHLHRIRVDFVRFLNKGRHFRNKVHSPLALLFLYKGNSLVQVYVFADKCERKSEKRRRRISLDWVDGRFICKTYLKLERNATHRASLNSLHQVRRKSGNLISKSLGRNRRNLIGELFVRLKVQGHAAVVLFDQMSRSSLDGLGSHASLRSKRRQNCQGGFRTRVRP